jgi:hypothetical protein
MARGNPDPSGHESAVAALDAMTEKRVHVGPADVVVITMPRGITPDVAAEAADELDGRFPDNFVLCFAGDGDLAAVPLESVARALYAASGGDEGQFPWPCTGADHYRHLACAALAALVGS